MKKNLFILAVTAAALASCSNDVTTAVNKTLNAPQEITFRSTTDGMTRHTFRIMVSMYLHEILQTIVNSMVLLINISLITPVLGRIHQPIFGPLQEIWISTLMHRPPRDKSLLTLITNRLL